MKRLINLSKLSLETNRLILRAFKDTDLADFHEYAKTPGVGELCGWKHHESLDESKLVLDMFIKGGNVLAVVLKATNKVIGSISLDSDSFNNEANEILYGAMLGYVIGKDYWHMGYMSEAVREIIRYAYLELELDYVKASFYISNTRSKRVLEKRGFSFLNYFEYKTRFNTMESSEMWISYRRDYLNSQEHVALYDCELNRTNKWIYRGSKIPNGYYRGVVDIIIKNTKYDRYLVTKRDRNKESHPSKYETTGGAISFNEDERVSAIREVYEEAGIKIADSRLSFLYKTTIGSVVFFEFYAECDCELDSVILQKGETEEYHWLTKAEYLKLFNSDLVAEGQRIRLSKALEERL